MHHAIILEGTGDTGKEGARMYVQNQLGISFDTNPDIFHIVIERFSITDARILKERASQSPFGSAQVFIIVTELILREAQNALLKLFEEPVQDTYFILVIPTINTLLETVRSRMICGGKIQNSLKENSLAKTFLQSTVNERVHLLESFIKNKDRVQARIFLDSIEEILHVGGMKKNANQLRELLFVRTYLSDTSSSLKMLLEHIAITL